MTPQRRRRSDSRAVMGAAVDDPFRFMSTVVDWRRVLTGAVVGIPCALAVYFAGGKVIEARVDDQREALERVRADIVAGDARVLSDIRRELDGIRQDVRDIRAQQGKR